MINSHQFDIKSSQLATRIAKEKQIPYFALMRIILTAPYRYKHYEIPKRGNTEVKRKIAHPAKELKLIQRWVVKNVLNNLEIHEAASAYEKNTSISKNAAKHAASRYLLKMDFKGFFPSIVPQDLLNCLSQSAFNAHDLYFLQQVLFCKDKASGDLLLSIGAPSSPKISNIIMYDMDKEIAEYCAEKEITYTRYADDLTFSTSHDNILKDCELFIADLCSIHKTPQLYINTDKTVHTSKKHHRRVTGLVLSNEGTVSLGRDRKRTIRAALHNYSKNKVTDPDELNKLRGWLAFAKDSEPLFLERLEKKYRDEIVHLLGMRVDE